MQAMEQESSALTTAHKHFFTKVEQKFKQWQTFFHSDQCLTLEQTSVTGYTRFPSLLEWLPQRLSEMARLWLHDWAQD